MSYRCYTCGRSEVESAEVAKCQIPHCTTKRELEKDRKTAQQKKWAEEAPDKWEGWLGG